MRKIRFPETTSMRVGIALLLFVLPAMSFAGSCVYDFEYGDWFYSPDWELFLPWVIAGLLLAYPWKEWAQDHPGLATTFFSVRLLAPLCLVRLEQTARQESKKNCPVWAEDVHSNTQRH